MSNDKRSLFLSILLLLLLPFTFLLLLLLPFTLGSTSGDGCSNQDKAKNAANLKAQGLEYYIVTEYNKHNKRQRFASGPLITVSWGKAFPSFIIVKPSAFPVVCKPTSGGITPFEKFNNKNELDWICGESGEYRYNFTPANFYTDYYNIPEFCTNAPTIWQSQIPLSQCNPVLYELQRVIRYRSN